MTVNKICVVKSKTISFFLYIYIYICMYVCMYICVCVCVCVYIYVCMYVCVARVRVSNDNIPCTTEHRHLTTKI